MRVGAGAACMAAIAALQLRTAAAASGFEECICVHANGSSCDADNNVHACETYLEDTAFVNPSVVLAMVAVVFWVVFVPLFVASRVCWGGCGGCASEARYRKREVMVYRAASLLCLVGGVTLATLAGVANKNLTNSVEDLTATAEQWAALTLLNLTVANDQLQFEDIPDFNARVPGIPGGGWGAAELAPLAYDLQHRIPDFADRLRNADNGHTASRGALTMIVVVLIALSLGVVMCMSMAPLAAVHYVGCGLLLVLGLVAVALAAAYGLAGGVVDDVCAHYDDATTAALHVLRGFEDQCIVGNETGFLRGFSDGWREGAGVYVCEAACGDADACGEFFRVHASCGWASMHDLPVLAGDRVTESLAEIIAWAPHKINGFDAVAAPLSDCSAVTDLTYALRPSLCGEGVAERVYRIGIYGVSLTVITMVSFLLLATGSKRYVTMVYRGGYARVSTTRAPRPWKKQQFPPAQRIPSVYSTGTAGQSALSMGTKPSTSADTRRSVSWADDQKYANSSSETTSTLSPPTSVPRPTYGTAWGRGAPYDPEQPRGTDPTADRPSSAETTVTTATSVQEP